MKFPAVLLSLALALICSAPAHAQGHSAGQGEVLRRRLPPVELRLQVGFDHRSRGTQPGAWSPVAVAVTNHTDHELAGTLKLSTVDSAGISGGSRVARDVKVASHRSVLVNATVFVSPGDTRLEATVTAQSGEVGNAVEALLAAPRYLNAVVVLGESKADSANPNPTYPHDDLSRAGRDYEPVPMPMLGHVLSDDNGGMEAATERMLVLQASPTTMPDRWIAYDGVTSVLITDPSVLDALTEAQWMALQSYVRAGGRLVFELGDRMRAEHALASRRVSTYLPAHPGDEQTVDHHDLMLRMGGSCEGTPGNIRITDLAPDPKRRDLRIVRSSTFAAMVVAPEGLGQIVVLGFSLVDPRVATIGRNLQDLVRRILHPSVEEILDFDRKQGAAEFARQVDYELKSEELTQIPSHKILLAFLLAYCLLVGPLNRFAFAALRRPLGAWLVMPFIVVGFMGLALTKLAITRPETPLLREITVLQTVSGKPEALSRSYLSLYSPERAVYQLEYAKPDTALHYLVHSEHRGLGRETLSFVDGVVSESPTGAQRSDPASRFRLAALPLAPRSSANLSMARSVDLDRGITLGEKGQATITNNTKLTLEGGVYVSSGSRMHTIPSLAPGQSATVDTGPISNRLSDFTQASNRDHRVFASITSRMSQHAGAPAAILWTHSSVVDLKCTADGVAPTTSAVTFIVVHAGRGAQ